MIPLTNPPSYEYKTCGPWFVAHIDDEGRSQAWIMHVFESAVIRFWMAAQIPKRRVLVDAYGITVMATMVVNEDDSRMSGTRQAMDATLKMVTEHAGQVENQAFILRMIEGVRSLDGQSL